MKVEWDSMFEDLPLGELRYALYVGTVSKSGSVNDGTWSRGDEKRHTFTKNEIEPGSSFSVTIIAESPTGRYTVVSQEDLTAN